jgi:hypothetical protein
VLVKEFSFQFDETVGISNELWTQIFMRNQLRHTLLNKCGHNLIWPYKLWDQLAHVKSLECRATIIVLHNVIISIIPTIVIINRVYSDYHHRICHLLRKRYLHLFKIVIHRKHTVWLIVSLAFLSDSDTSNTCVLLVCWIFVSTLSLIWYFHVL